MRPASTKTWNAVRRRSRRGKLGKWWGKRATNDYRARGVRRQEGDFIDVIRSSGYSEGYILDHDKKDMLRILYTTARSIKGKVDILRTYVYDLKPSIVCISEACTNSLTSSAFLSLDNYSLVVRADDTIDGWCRGVDFPTRKGGT